MVLIANFILGMGGGGDLNLAGTILSDYCPKEKNYMITALTVF